MTPLGIDPETLRLAAQCLNHYATLDPQRYTVKTKFALEQAMNAQRGSWAVALLFP